jgi:cytochrome c553
MLKMTLIALMGAALVLTLTALKVEAGPLDSPGAQKSLVCSACHGFAGNAPGNAMPILAGMNTNYFKKAIKDYAEGKRPSPEMEPYSKYVMHLASTRLPTISPRRKNRRAPPQRRTQNRSAEAPRWLLNAPPVTVPKVKAMPSAHFPRFRASPPAICALRWRYSAAINANSTTPRLTRTRREFLRGWAPMISSISPHITRP